MAEVEKKKPATKTPANNIQFVGKARRYNPETDKFELVARNAPPFVMDGTKIKLPEGIEKGAFVEPGAAKRLIELFPQDFKTPTIKGEQK